MHANSERRCASRPFPADPSGIPLQLSLMNPMIDPQVRFNARPPA
jgi:hypothetical protein